MGSSVSDRVYIISLGCPKNTVDSEGIGQLLRQQGYRLTDQPRRADLLIVNTCGFVEAARQESLEELQELAAHKRRGQLLVAAGCLPERKDFPLTTMVPRLDGCISTRHWPDFPAFIDALRESKRSEELAGCYRWEPRRPEGGTLVASFQRRALTGGSAYVKIADGCDASCAFCAIPQIKGPQHSKSPDDIFAEARRLVDQGVKEIILIAQDSTAYGRDLGMQDALPGLMADILQAAPDLTWLRVMYTYPQHITPRFIQVMAEDDRVCRYVDMPLQHSHPDVLRRMRRPDDIERVKRLISDLRAAMPDIAIRTTFIVGYPGETEAEFAHLFDFMQEIAFDKMGVFTYSREEGTLAASLPGQVPDDVKQARYHRAMALQQEISARQNEKQVGRDLDVLVEGQGDGISVGRSYRDAPEIDGLVLLQGIWQSGEVIRARIAQSMEYDLVGEVLSQSAQG